MEHVSLVCVSITASLPILIAPVCTLEKQPGSNPRGYLKLQDFLRTSVHVNSTTKMETGRGDLPLLNNMGFKKVVFFHVQ
jgi:hypothetical protein